MSLVAKSDFPILQQQAHGKPLVYLDSSATTQKPRCVLDSLAHYYEQDNANVHRGVYELSQRATRDYEKAREHIAAFINAKAAKELVFVRGTTEAINLVAYSLSQFHIKAGDEIIISEMEHHSNIVPWQVVCQQTGAVLKVIPISDQGELHLEAYKKLLNEKTKLVAVVHVSNALGTINPVKEMVALAHAHNVPVLLDGAQGTPHLKVDVQDLNCDFYAFSAHKMYGPMGIGALYAKAEWLEKMPPYQTGGDMIRRVSFDKTEYNVVPHKFEAGTPNVGGAIAFAEATKYLERIGLENIASYEHELLTYATHELNNLDDVTLIGTATHKAAVISFIMHSAHPHDVGTILDYEGIAVRAGHHCAMPLMERLAIPATVRASLGIYNTKEDIDRLVTGLNKVTQLFSGDE